MFKDKKRKILYFIYFFMTLSIMMLIELKIQKKEVITIKKLILKRYQ